VCRHRTPGVARRCRPWATEKWMAEARGIRRSPASDPAVGPVTNPAGWDAHWMTHRCSTVDGAVAMTKTPLPTRRSTAARTRRVTVESLTSWSRSVAVVITPWWAASHVVEAVGRSDIEDPPERVVVEGCREGDGTGASPTIRVPRPDFSGTKHSDR